MSNSNNSLEMQYNCTPGSWNSIWCNKGVGGMFTSVWVDINIQVQKDDNVLQWQMRLFMMWLRQQTFERYCFNLPPLMETSKWKIPSPSCHRGGNSTWQVKWLSHGHIRRGSTAADSQILCPEWLLDHIASQISMKALRFECNYKCSVPRVELGFSLGLLYISTSCKQNRCLL